MNILVALVGWMLVAIGLLGIARPHLMLAWVLSWPTDVRLYVTVATRIILGLVFIFAAPKCRFPRFIYAIGIIALIAGLVYLFLGASRLEAIVQWMSGQSTVFIQLLYAATAIFGALLVYSGFKRR